MTIVNGMVAPVRDCCAVGGVRVTRRFGTLSGTAAALLPILLLAGLLLPSPPSVDAQERILRYDSEVEILPDGSMEVTEHITVRAEGSNIRRGIYRDFPTRYRDRYGNRVRVAFEVVSVERNGAPEAWFTERISNGVRLNTGGDDFLPVPAEYRYTLRFRTTRQLGFFEEHDELYWNAIGTGWTFPIEGGEVEVRLPAAVPVDQLHAEGYTGPQGAQGSAYEALLPEPGVARYRLTGGLAPREGLTIVLTFPKGIVEAPTTSQRAGWFLADNRGVFLALLGFIGLLWFCVTRWQEVGRDPRPGVIIPRYRPPEGHGPAALRYLTRMGRYDARCFSSDLLLLAVAGRLRVGNRKRLVGEEWWVEGPGAEGAGAARGARNAEGVSVHRDASGDDADLVRVAAAQERMARQLLPGGQGRLDFKSSNATRVQAAFSAHQKALDEAMQPHYFQRNGRYTAVAAAIAAGTMVLAFALSGGNGIPAIVVVSVLMMVSVVVFGFLIQAPTPEGRKLLDHIEGLKLYLGVAERDDLARLPGPEQPPLLDAGRYEALLPFAMALQVEDAWTRKFTAVVGAAAAAEAARRMTWYSGSRPPTDLGSFTRSMGSSLTSSIASSSSPPGSSSGSGGGGSSGGGGGGGGGGGR